MMEKVDILSQYDEKQKLYTDFLKYFFNTITGILDTESIALQSVDKRLKKRESLEKKIKLKKKYKKIEEITDICGMRIITYFSDDVDKIASFIKEEFEIDEDNSVDKREIDDPTKFGYVSLHYIVSLKDNRAELPEARRFKDLKVEIQIRTILQHAWAEIEHDLGYKTVGDIPVKVKRSFSRLASIIELADEEFVRIKESTEAYSKDVINKIGDNEDSILIDIVTLTAFIKNDTEYLRKIELLNKSKNISIKYDIADEDIKKYLSRIVSLCIDLKINTISELKKVFTKYSDLIDVIYEETGVIGIAETSPLLEVLGTLHKENNLNMTEEDFIEKSISDFEKELAEAQAEEYAELAEAQQHARLAETDYWDGVDEI